MASAHHVERLAVGPGLAAGGTLRDRVALDERLRRTACPSLQYAATRAHARRKAVRAELVVEACGALVLGDHEVGGLGAGNRCGAALGAVGRGRLPNDQKRTKDGGSVTRPHDDIFNQDISWMR